MLLHVVVLPGDSNVDENPHLHHGSTFFSTDIKRIPCIDGDV